MAFARFGISLLPEWVLPPARGSQLGKFALFVCTYLLYRYQSFFSWLSFCAESLKQIIQRFVGVFFDQLNHSLQPLVPAVKTWTRKTYIRHNGLPMAIPNISERHFCTFMIIDAQFRIINVGDFVQWDCHTN